MEEKNSATTKNDRGTVSVAIIGGAIIAVLLILSTLWINHSEQSGTSDAVHSVSELYLRELTDRREQVINARINVRVENFDARRFAKRRKFDDLPRQDEDLLRRQSVRHDKCQRCYLHARRSAAGRR